MNRAHPSRSAGVTLLELVVALAVLGVLTLGARLFLSARFGEKEKVRHGAAGTRGGGGGTTAEQYDARSGRGRPWITVSRAPTSTDRASSTAPAGSYRMTAPYGAPGS